LIQKLRHGKNGDLWIDNNASERAVRPVAIGRKNWMVVGSKTAGARATMLMSLIASCKSNLVERWALLRDVLVALPRGASLESLPPQKWLTAHPEHRWNIAEPRQLERHQSAPRKHAVDWALTNVPAKPAERDRKL
jgi:hypothetical protein